MTLKQWHSNDRTRSSAIAEGPRDASCQLKYCQLPRYLLQENSLLLIVSDLSTKLPRRFAKTGRLKNCFICYSLNVQFTVWMVFLLFVWLWNPAFELAYNNELIDYDYVSRPIFSQPLVDRLIQWKKTTVAYVIREERRRPPAEVRSVERVLTSFLSDKIV